MNTNDSGCGGFVATWFVIIVIFLLVYALSCTARVGWEAGAPP